MESGLLITVTSLSMTISYAADSNVVYPTSDAVRPFFTRLSANIIDRAFVTACTEHRDCV